MSWAAGSTVIFTWTGSAWQLADSTAQNYINTHFLFDSNGMTVFGSSSTYRSRVGAGKFSILDSSNKELMYIRSSGSGNSTKVELRTSNFGQIYLGSAMSDFIVHDSGFLAESVFGGFRVNNVTSVEAWRVAPTSGTANASASFSAWGFSSSVVHSVDVYYTAVSSGETRVVRANFSGKSTAYVTLTNLWSNGNAWYCTQEKVTLTKDSYGINIIRQAACRGYLNGDNGHSSNGNIGTQFNINYIAPCFYNI